MLEHLRNFYGENRVSNVATFKLEKSKSAILTAARGLGIAVEDAQYLSSLVTAERGQLYTLKQMYYGDEENNIQPNQTFINEINKFDKLWEVASRIEGLICGMGIHAGGVVFKHKDFTETSALMKAPDGTIITQFELHDLEDVSEIKMDLLSIEAADKIQSCLELLIKDGYIKEYPSLRETYEHALNVYKLDRLDPKMWDMVHNHEIISLFQMEKDSGIRGIGLTNPRNVDDLATLNSVIRLMATEKGAETPLDKYARFRKHPEMWDIEMRQAGLTNDEIKLMHRELDISNGMCITQEQFMRLVQLPECGGWDLQWADKLRKSIAKKNPKEYEVLTEQFYAHAKEKNLHKEFYEYVWNKQIALSRGYGFNASHTLSYSIIALQEMNLAYKYPIVFWNTANLIVDSGGVQTVDYAEAEDEMLEVEPELDEDENEENQQILEEEELEEWEEANPDNEINAEDKKKKKEKNIDYGRIAATIGRMYNYGIKVSPPDINNSSYTFTPVVESNTILYGMRGIARISGEKVSEIINNRPYASLKDFLLKNKLNKIQITNLIKSGAFDTVENKSREEIMHNYIDSIADKKQDLNLRNMQMLINKDLIPENMLFYGKLFLFNKFLKENKNGEYYMLNDSAISFLDKYFEIDSTCDGTKILQKDWDKIYKKAMDPMREYLKAHKTEMLAQLNDSLYNEMAEKYAYGNISKWEMQSLSFYSHDHELKEFQNNFDDFFKLSEEPEIEYSFVPKNGEREIKVYKIHTIIGTVIDKNKMKNTVTLLTPTGVVEVKIYKNQFAIYDKQISEMGADGHKHIKEKSWFSRGTLLRIQGIRRGNNFIPKKTKSSIYPIIMKIINTDNNYLEYQQERVEVVS